MKLSKSQIIHIAIFVISTMFIMTGIMCLLTVAEIVPIVAFMSSISNIIGRYVVVIVIMAIGIMSFSSASTYVENAKLRNFLLITITSFSTIMTLPLVYVFVALFFAHNGIIGAVGDLMMLDKIVEGLYSIVGNGWWIYLVLVVLFIMSIVFITVPLVTGVLAIKGKTIKIGKNSSDKMGISIADLPIIERQKKANRNQN